MWQKYKHFISSHTKKETNKPSVTPRQDPGRFKSVSNQAKSQVWNNKLAFLTPHCYSFLQGQLQRPQLHQGRSCREHQHHSITQTLHIQGAQATGLTRDPLTSGILLHVQVVTHPTGLQLPPDSHFSGLRRRSSVHRVTELVCTSEHRWIFTHSMHHGRHSVCKRSKHLHPSHKQKTWQKLQPQWTERWC